MEFLQANCKDIDQLVHMRINYLNEHFNELPPEQRQLIIDKLPGYFSKHIEKDLIAFVAKEQGEVISTAMLLIIEKPANPRFPTGVVGEVMNVYTNPDHRRNGIAKRLMEMLLQYSKELKLDFIELKATKDGYPLYKELGFTVENISETIMKYRL